MSGDEKLDCRSMQKPGEGFEPSKHYAHYLSLHQYANLDLACTKLIQAYGWGCYLVGSSLVRKDFRDVDVRFILDDSDFDAMFRFQASEDISQKEHKKLIELGISTWLKQQTGLEIDFQFQRRTEANELYGRGKASRRNAVGVKFTVTNPDKKVEAT